jgi:glycosyltransferase involved in cell wall biosynthesis
MRIALIGSYPDYGGNIGGISMHIKRMRNHLLLRGHEPVVYAMNGRGNPSESIFPTRRLRQIPLIMVRERNALAHLHVTGWKNWAISAIPLRLRRQKTILTVHGEGLRMSWKSTGAVGRRLIRTTLRQYDHIVAVNEHVQESVLDILGPVDNLSMIPAFVPPVPSQTDRDAVPARAWQFIREHQPIVSMNGWVNWLRGTQDLYGFDVMLRAVRDLLRQYPGLGVVAAVCGIAPGADNLWEQIQSQAATLGVQNRICWITEGCEYYPILERSNLMIRPTRTDGWPLSIGEAMYFGVPVIASDVCARPEGTILFAAGNADDLADKINRTLASKVRPGAIRLDYHERLMALYETMYIA